jgi:hypothetical protein
MSKLKCSIEGCSDQSYSRGLCKKHYTRQIRYGSTNLQRLPAEERFWLKVDKDGPLWNGTHCWVWKGTQIRSGYGRFSVNGKKVLTHRFSYEQLVGLVPGEFELDHLCRNRICCNPCHLEPVIHSENVKRGDLEAMSHQKRKTHCPNGHEYSPENTWVNKYGHRSCRRCHAERQNRRYHLLKDK